MTMNVVDADSFRVGGKKSNRRKRKEGKKERKQKAETDEGVRGKSTGSLFFFDGHEVGGELSWGR